MNPVYTLLLATALLASGHSEAQGQKMPPIAFEENRGQLRYSDGRACPDVRYFRFSNDESVLICDDRIRYILKYPKAAADKQQDTTWRYCEVSIAGPDSEGLSILPLTSSSFYSNYFFPGNTGNVTRVATWDSIEIKNLQPGIDVGLGRAGETFRLRTNAFSSMLRLQITGVAADDSASLNALISRVTNAPAIRADRPAFIERIGDSITAFKLSPEAFTGLRQLSPDRSSSSPRYAKTAEQSWEISLNWSTYFGGLKDEYGYSCATDSQNNAILSGLARSQTLPVPGSPVGENRGSKSYTSYVLKVSESGKALWATYFGGSSLDFLKDVAVDPQGNIIAVGHTLSNDFPVTANAARVQQVGAEGFIVSMSPSGTINWSTLVGGNSADGLAGCAIAGDGSIYVTGSSMSTDLPNLRGNFSLQPDSDPVLISKYSSSGQPQWSSYLGNTGRQTGLSCYLWKDRLFIGGVTMAKDFPVAGTSFQTVLKSAQDGFIACIDTSGNYRWGTYYGGDGEDAINSLVVDDSGVYISGYTASSDFPVSDSATRKVRNGPSDAFLAALTHNGQMRWSTYYGTAFDEQLESGKCALDRDGHVYLTSAGVANAATDIFIAGFSRQGQFLWAQPYGGSDADVVFDIATDLKGNIIVSGATKSFDFTRVNAAYANNAGFWDAFLMQIARPELESSLVPTAGMKDGVLASPNPSKGQLVLHTQDFKDLRDVVLELQIRDMSGMVVHRQALATNQSSVELPASLRNGQYFVVLRAPSASHTQAFTLLK